MTDSTATLASREIPVEPILSCNNCGSSAAEIVSKSSDFEYDTCSNEFEFARCKDCGLVYLKDRPAICVLSTIYPESYIPYEFNEHLGPVLARARDYVQGQKVAPISKHVPENAFIVDVGCGGGEFLRILRRLGPDTWRLAGVDISQKSIDNLADAGIEGICGRFEAMDWLLPKLDAIVMNQVIEHLDDPAVVVKRAAELLKPGGVLIIETPSVDAWDAKMFWDRYWGGWHTPRHWTLYTAKTLGDLMVNSGLEIVETRHILSPNFWLQSLHHKLSEGSSLSKKIAPYFDVKSFVPLCVASAIDVVQLALTGKTSNFRMIGRRPVESDQKS